jgi:hypothetical protein
MALNEMTALGEAATAGTTYDNFVDATGNVAMDLPPIEVMYGQSIKYTKTDATAGVLTITPCEAAGVTINGGASTTVTAQYESITLHAENDATDWIIIATTGAGVGDASTSDGLDQFAATTSAELAGVISDETGTGLLTFATSPTLTTPRINTFHTSTGATRRTLTAEPVTPVNYFEESISATGDPVYQQAAGSDTNIDIGMYGKGTGSALLGPSVGEGALASVRAGSAGNMTRKVKKITGMTDATFTDILTVTVPNAAHAAGIFIRASASLGDADSSACDSYFVTLARQSGAATVLEGDIGVTSVAQPSATGAQTIVLAFQLSSLTGAVGATQTFTVQAKITRGGGASDNHYMTFVAELLNNNTGGVTMT